MSVRLSQHFNCLPFTGESSDLISDGIGLEDIVTFVIKSRTIKR